MQISCCEPNCTGHLNADGFASRLRRVMGINRTEFLLYMKASDMRETWNVIVAGCIETDDLAGRITPKTDKILADHFPSLRKTIAMQQTIASVPTAQQVWH